ncbi:Bystin-domain-containing protein [Trichodelitschia bisporula]|uniref:Bystin-domain-containing protein n=1 Tax=Trichodelitschia bisporula TaxID=703511 RepID=A0A6G1I4N0_9PEZI|nr:Bystin-domain-containing protein [Trichodelitschia bisporula]
MPRAPRPSQAEAFAHRPLADEYSPAVQFKQKAPKKRKSRQDEETEEHVINTKASRKILRIGQDLADEDAEEQNAKYVPTHNPAFDFQDRLGEAQDDEEEAEEEAEEWGDEEIQEVTVEDMDPSDLALFNRFNPPAFDDPILRGFEEAEPTTNLADLILEKIAQHEAAEGREPREDEMTELPPMAVEVYTQVGLILSRYKSGKLPKPFKLLPTLPPPMLELIIPLTVPEKWTPNAIFQATRLFISSNSTISQGFLTNILLDRVRDDIQEHRKLNVHLYDAVKKALYKPKEFFKGFLFPLVSSGTCTLREAHIVASVLTKVSIPVLHSAYALTRLCELAAEQMSLDTEAAGATNVIIKALLEKRYALPYQTVDALVFHFLRFRPMDDAADQRLPVIWHQCFLAFAQRYRNEITEDQREALLDLLLSRGHKDIGPEIRRELLAGRGRGVVVEPGAVNGGDDTLMGDA